MTKPIQTIQRYLKDNSVRGWLTFREGALLYNLAKGCSNNNSIVEIGSWEGKSTVYISNGSKAGNGAHIFAVDPHTGPEQSVNDNVRTYDVFMKNITGGGAVELITPIVKFSEDAAKDFNRPIGFIFIDGGHAYEAVKIDFDSWYPKVVEGGVIAFHDSIKYDGPRRLLSEIIPRSRLFKGAGIVDSIFFMTKTSHNSGWDKLRNSYIMILRGLIEYGTYVNYKIHFPKGVKVMYKKLTSYIQGRNI
ncbi:MAG: Translation elongation factor P [Parcubacteria group bacterium GW2011_GWC1_39_29]|jgi:predicted O-methyltransferase YrrM|nr:MAG: Translation elongation factor P [Parcubacteria group bacterium GW2011_GWC1_39_29]